MIRRNMFENLQRRSDHLVDLLSTGGTSEAKWLIETKGVDVNAPDKNGYYPINMAVKTYNEEMVKFLLAKGAKPDVTDRFGLSTFAWAIGQPKIQQILEEAIKTNTEVMAHRAVNSLSSK